MADSRKLSFQVDLDKPFEVQRVFAKAGGLFYMNFVNQEPLIAEPLEDEEPKPGR